MLGFRIWDFGFRVLPRARERSLALGHPGRYAPPEPRYRPRAFVEGLRV